MTGLTAPRRVRTIRAVSAAGAAGCQAGDVNRAVEVGSMLKEGIQRCS
jgi:hypothetical protein